MFILHESPRWLWATGLVGLFCGWAKGRPGWGLLLGLIFGPFGCLAIMLLPSVPRKPLFGGRVHVFRQPGAAGSAQSAGSASTNAGPETRESTGKGGPGCPRCGRAVAPRDKACGHCGNVLMPIRYAVEGNSATR